MPRRLPSRSRYMEHRMELFILSPVTLRDSYVALSKEDRHTFLKLIAAHCTGREPLMMLDELPRAERWQYNELAFGAIIKAMLPILIKHARELTQKKPLLADAE